MRAFSLQKELLGYPIQMRLTPLDSGAHILLCGGQRSHIGAVALGKNGQIVDAASYPGHKEGQVAERWAAALSGAWRVPVTVACGIHYENAAREQIGQVLQICDVLLTEALELWKESGPSGDDFRGGGGPRAGGPDTGNAACASRCEAGPE